MASKSRQAQAKVRIDDMLQIEARELEAEKGPLNILLSIELGKLATIVLVILSF